LGLAYLAAAAREAGHQVRIVDANALGLEPAQSAEEALRDAPGVVGLTATTATITLAAEIAAAIKARQPGTATLVGGVHTSFLPSRTLEEFSGIDIAARGEAERSLPLLLAAIEAGDDPLEVPGFAHRLADGGFHDTGMPAPLDALDSLPQPARDLLPMERYRCVDSNSFSTILASRGCPARCVYCAVPAVFGRRMRYRDPEQVACEMDEVHRRWGVSFFSFLDDTFTTRHDWVHSFCDHAERLGLPRRLRWICLTRPDMADLPLMRRMKRAGCVRVELSVESGSDTGRAFLRKGMREEAVVAGFAAAREAGLSTMGFAILNIPGETERDVQRTFDLVRRIDPDFLQVSFMTPYPGTELWKLAEEQGLISTRDWSRYSFLNNIVLRNDAMTPEQLQAQYLRFVRRFYLRPGTAIKLARLVATRTTHLRPLLRTAALGLSAALLARVGGQR